jgi:primosomal protein N' (replication factor Y)
MAQAMRQYFGECVLGPEPPAVARVQALHIRKIMLKVNPSHGVTRIRQSLYHIQQALAAQGVLQGVLLYYDVDPY